MDIKIEAPGHPNQDQLHEYYTSVLNKKYKGYDFVKAIDVKVVKERNEFEVSLQLKPEKGTMLFAKDINENEKSALSAAIKKMNSQIEKYKQLHYHSAQRRNRD